MIQGLTSAPDPWERQDGESEPAWKAFVLYRDQTDKRVLATVAQQLHKSLTIIYRWGTRWQWVARAREYDRHLDALQRKEREKEILAFRKRVAQQARGKAQSLMLPDMAISAKLQASGGVNNLQDLPLADLVAMSTRAAPGLAQLHRAEALALGDVERQAEPVEDDVLTQAIQNDDELLSIAAGLVQRASTSTVGAGSGAPAAGGVREPGEQGAVAEPAAPDVPKPEAGGGTAP